MAWTTPRTWVAGETVTAAIMNTHFRDNLNAMGGASWTSYTPTWTSTGTAPAIGNGTLAGRYAEAGKTILVYHEFVAGSTTTYGTGVYRWALPKTSRTLTAGQASFGGWSYGEDSASVGYYLLPRYASTTTFEYVYDDATFDGGIAAAVGQTTPFTWGVGDLIRGFFFYEAA